MRSNRLTDGFGTKPMVFRADKTFETVIKSIVKTEGYASTAEAIYDLTYRHYRKSDSTLPVTTLEMLTAERDAITQRLEELKRQTK